MQSAHSVLSRDDEPGPSQGREVARDPGLVEAEQWLDLARAPLPAVREEAEDFQADRVAQRLADLRRDKVLREALPMTLHAFMRHDA